ncbi:SCO family protein [Chitinimonas sp.]|uniref:SCO family protein n=1 Tax=Chitinimonas sp. TaxID=1934313 RepID=UPI0035AEA330
MRYLLGAAMVMCCLLGGISAQADKSQASLPADSLYRMTVPLTNQQGAKLELGDLAGKPALITMFYGNCAVACPVTLHSVQSIVNSLPAEQRGELTVLLLSLDPAKDTAATLQGLAKTQQMQDTPYLFAVGKNERDTRALAAALGIRYRRLSNGEINHSSRLVVTNAQGQINFTSDNLAPAGDPAVRNALTHMLVH